MPRKYSTTSRLQKSYTKYVSDLAKRATIWAKKGYTPVDTSPLTFNDFVANREFLKSMGIASGNITRTLISQQLYEFNQSQATNIFNQLKTLGIDKLNGKKLTLESLKSELGKDALSAINEVLKDTLGSGYDRAK